MTMREMQIFLEVARTLNMSTAGKSLYLSQSTVSQSILNIEFSNYIEGWNMIYSTPAKSHCVLEQI